MVIGEETKIQICLCNWLKQLHPEWPFIHIANERTCSIQQGALLKKMGVRRGVSDLFFPKSNVLYHGMWLELKSKSGKLTEHQIKFLQDMRDLGYEARAAWGFDEAIDIIQRFYK